MYVYMHICMVYVCMCVHICAPRCVSSVHVWTGTQLCHPVIQLLYDGERGERRRKGLEREREEGGRKKEIDIHAGGSGRGSREIEIYIHI